MSDVLTMQTGFGDIAELAQGLVGRVTGGQIVINVGEPVQAGTAVRFQVLLADGTLAFWGDGQCGDVNDLGDEVEAHARYELLLHGLEFPDERSAPVFEYLVNVSEAATPSDELTSTEESPIDAQEAEAAQPGESFEAQSAAQDVGDDVGRHADQDADQDAFPVEHGTSEVAMDDLEPMEAAGPATEPPVAEQGSWDDGAAAQDAFDVDAASVESLPPDSLRPASMRPESVRPVSMRPAADDGNGEALPGVLSDRPGAPPGGVLTRTATGTGWRPVAPEKSPPAARSGLFQYAFGPLPAQTQPPRPELDPSLHVTPAPRPAAN